MFCNECGTNHPIYSNYCTADGAVLETKINGKANRSKIEFCASCGGKVASSAQYCLHCGGNLSGFSLQTTQSVIQAIQIPSKKVDLPTFNSSSFLSKNNMKNALIAAVLAIVLVLVSAGTIMNYAEQMFLDFIEETEGEVVSAKELRSLSFVEEQIKSESGMSLSLPTIYGITTFVTLLHNINTTFDLDANAFSESSKVTFHQENLMLAGLIVPIAVLLIVGAVLGYLARKSKSSLGEPLIIFSGIYTLFIVISALISKVKFGTDSKGVFGEILSIQAVLKFSFIDALLTGLFLALIVTGVSAYLTYYGKNIFLFLHEKSQYVQYTVYSMLLFIVILAVISIIGFSSMDVSEIVGVGTAPIIAVVLPLALTHASIWIMNLAHFNPLAFKMGMWDGAHSISINLFSSAKGIQNSIAEDYELEDMLNTLVLTDGTLPTLVKLSFLLPAVLLIFAGFRLVKTHQSQIQQILLFSGIYALVMTVLSVASRLKFEVFVDQEGTNISIYSSILPSFLSTFVMAAICFAIGGLLKKRLASQ